MTPLPAQLGGGVLRVHRIDRERHAPGWDSGEGAFQAGGRWNSVGTRAVYCALDPATAILEVAVHKGFQLLDRQPHILTSFTIAEPDRIEVFQPEDFAKKNWLETGVVTPDQRQWGDRTLQTHKMVVLPSAVSRQSWNLIFQAPLPEGWITDVIQIPFVLDPRLNAASI